MGHIEVKLLSLSGQISESLDLEDKFVDEQRWFRAEKYAEARNLLPSNKAFGEWCKNCPGAGAGTEESSVITRMMKLPRRLTKEQFLAIGYTTSLELVADSLWKNFPEEMSDLVEVCVLFPTIRRQEVRNRIKAIKAGSYTIELVKPPAPLTAQEQVAALVAISKGKFRASDDCFFSHDAVVQSIQKDTVVSDPKYFTFMFGVTLDNLVEYASEAIINEEFRKLARAYHPDRTDGDPTLMTVVNRAREQVDGLRAYMLLTKQQKESQEALTPVFMNRQATQEEIDSVKG